VKKARMKRATSLLTVICASCGMIITVERFRISLLPWVIAVLGLRLAILCALAGIVLIVLLSRRARYQSNRLPERVGPSLRLSEND
jgi:hypothetical protein